MFVPTCAKEIVFICLIICPQIPNYVKMTFWSLAVCWLISIHCHYWETLLIKSGNQKRSNVFPNSSANSFLNRHWPKIDIKKKKKKIPIIYCQNVIYASQKVILVFVLPSWKSAKQCISYSTRTLACFGDCLDLICILKSKVWL